MVTTDLEGNISVRGNANPRILLMEKHLLSLCVASDALKSIPAAEISRIEIITDPSARYDGEGGGEIINIITKRSFKPGMNGNMSMGFSTRKASCHK